MFQVIRTRNKEIMDVQSCFLSTTLQICFYCGHVIKSRTMSHLNFDCQLNLSKSHKGLVIISCVVSAQCRKVWLGGENAPPMLNRVKWFQSQKDASIHFFDFISDGNFVYISICNNGPRLCILR